MRYAAILLAALLYSGVALADETHTVINTTTGQITTYTTTGNVTMVTTTPVAPKVQPVKVQSFSITPAAQAQDAHIVAPFVTTSPQYQQPKQ